VEAMGKANSFRRALHRVYEDGAELTRHPRSGRITGKPEVIPDHKSASRRSPLISSKPVSGPRVRLPRSWAECSNSPLRRAVLVHQHGSCVTLQFFQTNGVINTCLDDGRSL
jgi:hypothetical protein